jgi:hypothetical protein
MKLKFLMILAVAGMAIAGCSASKNADGTTDSMGRDSVMSDTTKKMMDTTRTTPPDTTRKQ